MKHLARRAAPAPRRIVSLAPSATRILCELGARARLVGVTRWCKDVAPVDGLPQLGDCWNGDAQAVVRLKPDLVIGSVPYRAATVNALLARGLNFLAMNPRRLADVFSDVHLLGRVTGREAQAKTIVQRMRARLASLGRRAQAAHHRPRVYCEAWSNPLIASPPWVEEIVNLVGGRFVPAGGGRRVEAQEVRAAKPDVIILAWAATGVRARPEAVAERTGWSQLPAVRRRAVYVIRDEWLNTPAPILLRGAEAIASVLHPEIFGPPPRDHVRSLG